MFELAGEKPEQANADAATVMRIETALAKGSLDLVSRRDPEKVYHKMSQQELAALGPAFRWTEYFTATGAPRVPEPSTWPGRISSRPSTRQSRAPAWTTGRPISPGTCCTPRRACCPPPFVEENFNFYGKTLTGTEELRPRWKRCVDFTDARVGRGAGQQVRRAHLRRGRQGAHAENGGRARKGAGPGYPDASLDDPGHQAAGAGQAEGHHQQDRLSRTSGATIPAWRSEARRRHGQLASAPTSSSSSAS